MEKKFKRIPFDLEMAKKITNGEMVGRVVTRDGLSARIACFDFKYMTKNLLVLVDHGNTEIIKFYNTTGRFDCVKEHDSDLLLEVPSYKPKYEFKAFDKVLYRNSLDKKWCADLFGYFDDENDYYYLIGYGKEDMKSIKIIPYNEKTAHLLGTSLDYEEE